MKKSGAASSNPVKAGTGSTSSKVVRQKPNSASQKHTEVHSKSSSSKAVTTSSGKVSSNSGMVSISVRNVNAVKTENTDKVSYRASNKVKAGKL